MRIADELYFAPGVRFADVQWDNPSLTEQLKKRITGFYLDPARDLCGQGHAFAAGVLLVSCIDALARLQYGNGVGYRIIRYVRKEIPSLSPHAPCFYENFRNGLLHEARIMNGGQFSLVTAKTMDDSNGVLLINPRLLEQDVRESLDRWISSLEDDDVKRQGIANRLKKEFEEEIRMSRT